MAPAAPIYDLRFGKFGERGSQGGGCETLPMYDLGNSGAAGALTL